MISNYFHAVNTGVDTAMDQICEDTSNEREGGQKQNNSSLEKEKITNATVRRVSERITKNKINLFYMGERFVTMNEKSKTLL